MPAKSQAMQMASAIALHSPAKLFKRNRGLAKMGKEKLRHYAETPRKGLPAHATGSEARKRMYDHAFAG